MISIMGKTTHDFISLRVVQKEFLPLSRATLVRMCQDKVFKTAFKPGRGESSPWRVHRSEVIAHVINTQ